MADYQDPAWLAAMPTMAPAPPPSGGGVNPISAIGAGLSSGFHGALADVGRAGEALGTLTGWQGLTEGAQNFAQRQEDAAKTAGIDDLERNPWSASGIAYKVAQAVPSIAGIVGAAALTPEAAVPAWLARGLVAAPRLLGGEALEAGAGFAARKAALEGATATGRGLIGATVAGTPLMVGGNVETEEQAQGGQPITRGQAAAAIGLGVPEAAIGGLFPSYLLRGPGAGGAMASKLLRGAMVGVPVNAVQGALNTGLSQFLGDPDKPIGQRASEIVSSAMMSGIVGGVLGGAGAGVHHALDALGGRDPSTIDTPELAAATDPLVAGTEQPPTPAAPMPETTPSDQLLTQYQGLAAKTNRSDDENALHVQLGQELARRTQPGMPIGQGTLYTPEQVADRQPQVDAMRDQVVPDNASDNDPFVANFNAANEPELINALRLRVTTPPGDKAPPGGKIPNWLKDQATKYGVTPGKGLTIAEVLDAKTADFDKTQDARDWAAKTDNGPVEVAARGKLARLQGEIDDINNRLVPLHRQANDLSTPPKPAPQPAPPPEPPKPTEQNPDPVQTFRDTLAQHDQTPEARAAIDTINAHDGPSLVRDLRDRMATTGVQDQHPVIQGLMRDTGLIDQDGRPRDLDREHAALMDQVSALRQNADNPSLTDAERQDANSDAQRLTMEDGPIWHLEELQDLHAQADGAPQLPEDANVRPYHAQQWRDLEDARINATDPEVGKMADVGQSLLERDAPGAREMVKLIQDRIGALGGTARGAGTTDTDRGLPEAPLRQDGRTEGQEGGQTTNVEADGTVPHWGTAPQGDLPPQPRPKTPEEEAPKAFKAQQDRMAQKIGLLQKVLRVPNADPEARGIAETGLRAHGNGDPDALDNALQQLQAKMGLQQQAPQGIPKPVHTGVDPAEFKASSSRVFGDPTADSRVVKYVRNLTKALGLDGFRIQIKGDPNLRPYARVGRDANGNYTIWVRGGMSDALTVENSAHEVGHIVQFEKLDQAPKPTRDAVLAAWSKWHGRVTGTDSGKALDGLRLMREVRPRGIVEDAAEKIGEDTRLPDDFKQYITSFEEWFADNVARWATTSQKPLTTVEKFFKGLGDTMRKFAQTVSGRQFLPDAAVKDFMDRMGTNDLLSQEHEPVTREPVTVESRSPTRQETEEDARDKIQAAQQLKNRANELARGGVLNLGATMRKFVAYAANGRNLPEFFKKYLPAGLDHFDEQQTRHQIVAVKNKTFQAALRMFTGHTEAEQEVIGKHLFDLQAAAGINPDTPFAAHGRDITASPRRAEYEAKWNELRKSQDRLQTLGLMPATRALLAGGQLDAHMNAAALLHDVTQRYAAQGTVIPGSFKLAPGITFKGMLDAHEDGTLAKPLAFFKGVNDQMLRGATKFLAKEDERIGQLPRRERAKEKGFTSDLRTAVDIAKSRMDQAASGTYFPLSRSGDFYVSAKLMTDEKGVITPGAGEALGDWLHENQWREVGVLKDPENSSVMIRVETREQMERLALGLKELQKKGGVLDPAKEVANGMPDQVNTLKGLGSGKLQEFLAGAESAVKRSMPEGTDPAVVAALVRETRQRYLDALPDNAAVKAQQRRTSAQGFSTNIAQVFAKHTAMMARSTTGIETATAIARTREAMRNQAQAAKSDPSIAPKDRTIAQEAANEIMLREAQGAVYNGNVGINKLRSFVHALNFGLSPSYWITAGSQVPLIGHPYLAKTQGYLRAAKFVFGATPDAFRTMRAMFSGPDWMRGGLHMDNLRAAGLSDKRVQQALDLDNNGHLSGQGFTTWGAELGEGANPTGTNWRHLGNVSALYAEMLPRLIMGFAAHDAYEARPVKGMSAADYAGDVVSKSQFDYGPGHGSRMMGNYGFAGPLTPIVMQFHAFSSRLMQRMALEIRDLVSRDSTPEMRRQAGVFLVSQMAAGVAIAGTMGLPFAAPLAETFDKVYKALTGKDDMDVEGAYRTFLDHALGPTKGEAVAKGLPRALLGVDLSHLGFDRLLPFQRTYEMLVTDKRKFEDSYDDYIKDSAGAAFGEAAHYFEGGRDFINGDFMLGMRKVLPEGLKGLADAYYVSENGYRNAKGQKLPMTPSAFDVLKLAMGLHPSNQAQYDDAARIASGLKAQRAWDQQNIDTHLERAYLTGDQAGLRSWEQAGMQFQRNNPGMSGPITDFQRLIMQAQMGQTRADVLGRPIGLRMYDPGITSRLGFFHPESQQ